MGRRLEENRSKDHNHESIFNVVRHIIEPMGQWEVRVLKFCIDEKESEQEAGAECSQDCSLSHANDFSVGSIWVQVPFVNINGPDCGK